MSTPAAIALDELRHADRIIKVMLNVLMMDQKAKAGRKLEATRLVSDGMTRHHERLAAIEAASTVATSTTAGHLDLIAQQAASIISEGSAAEDLLQGMTKGGSSDAPPRRYGAE